MVPYEVARASYVLKPYILRLQACYAVRKVFIDRLKRDIDYRLKYLYIHDPENAPLHICWRRVPPNCLSIFRGLKNAQRLLSKEIREVATILQHFRPDQYEFVLQTIRME